MPTTLHVVPHTHWDREWYEPFEVYRFRLVKMADELLDVLESDEGFRHFNFDGQTAAIEDYLEVRPEARDRVAALVRAKRLAVGPWRILMDEFLCSPETIVRNMQQGVATARSLGGEMRVGYIPDSFGHIAQMPQILALAGLTDATVWRGVPAAVDRTVFRWIAPDGSSVRTAYLVTSYSNGATLPVAGTDLLVRAARIAEDLAPFRPGDVLLAMNGSDHRPPQAHLPQVFADANAVQGDIALRLGSMEEYLAAAPREDLPVWHGEMRSSARANLLMGVLSARMPLKQAEFRASAMLERAAEPLSALAGTDPGRLLDLAWRGMVENAAHDSVCGCGVDAVAERVHARYVEAARVGGLVADDALAALGERIAAPGIPSGVEALVAFNPSPRARTAVIEAELTPPVGPDRLAFRGPDGSIVGAQILRTARQVVVDMTVTGEQLSRIVPTIHARQLGELYVNAMRVRRGSRPWRVELAMGPIPEGEFDIESAKRTVEAAIAQDPAGSFHVLGAGPARSTVLVGPVTVDGLGWSVLEPIDGPAVVDAPATADGAVLSNGILRAEVDALGRVRLTDIATGTRYEGLFTIEDGADAGDEYNHSPPDVDHVVTDPIAAAVVHEGLTGPVEASLRIDAVLRIPAGLTKDGRRRARRTVRMPVRIDLSLRAGDPLLRAAVTIDNPATDHRVRVVFPTPYRADGSEADQAFHVTHRGLEAEGAAHEHGLPTFPSRRWVATGDGDRGLAVLHRGTPEYEVVDGGRGIAITLLRSVGWLSRQGMAYRSSPAGPALETPGAQLPGRHRFDLALYPHAGDWRSARVHDVAESFAYPVRTAVIRAHDGDLPASGSALTIAPGSVHLSALVRRAGAIECRVYNASDEPVEATLATAAPLVVGRAERVGILGEVLAEAPLSADGVVAVPLRGWEIATLRLS